MGRKENPRTRTGVCLLPYPRCLPYSTRFMIGASCCCFSVPLSSFDFRSQTFLFLDNNLRVHYTFFVYDSWLCCCFKSAFADGETSLCLAALIYFNVWSVIFLTWPLKRKTKGAWRMADFLVLIEKWSSVVLAFCLFDHPSRSRNGLDHPFFDGN